ncbi:MAG: RNA-binding domain-containing protein [Mangrovibacterium sp.]
MELQELQHILNQGEGLHVEFKKAQDGVPASLYDTVVSFLNREGGVILLGVSDDANVLGLTDQNIARMKQDVVTALNNPDVINPPYPLAVREVLLNNQTLLYIRVPVSSFVHKHGMVVFDRENDSDIQVIDEARIAQLYARKQQVFTENQIFSYLRMEDLDDQLFQKVRTHIANLNSTHPWLEGTNERILRDARFIKRDYTTGKEGLTLAAALVFGKDATIGSILPAYKIDVLVRRENLDRWDDRLSLRTNLIDSYLKVLDFLKRQWPEKFYIENDIRKDLRELILRELAANIIIHREYYSSLPTEIIIYKDRVVATNPNRARFSGPLDLETFCPEPKNPNIRAFFNVLSWADEIGSGIRNMHKYLRVYSGARPSFTEGDSFVSILPMLAFQVQDRYPLYLELAKITEDKLGVERIDILRDIGLNLEFKDITNNYDLALSLIKRWSKNSEKLHQLRFEELKKVGGSSQKSGGLSKNQTLTINNLEDGFPKKVGGSSQKSGGFLSNNLEGLLKKRSRVILSSLLLCLLPIKIDLLTEILGYKSRDRYRDDYLKPLKDNGLIGYTIPEQAFDPAQAYVITQKGRDFLGGNLII